MGFCSHLVSLTSVAGNIIAEERQPSALSWVVLSRGRFKCTGLIGGALLVNRKEEKQSRRA